MKRFFAGLAVLCALSWLSPVVAQTTGTTKVVGTCGTASYTAGKMAYPTQDTTGAACGSTVGGGGGVAGLTAEATASAVAAGTNKPQSEDTANGAARTELCVPGSTTCIDPTMGTAGTPAGGVSTVQGQTGMTPLDTNIKQVNGAAPSLTNPIFIANAEAADTTGTFTNATQTTSVTNTTADGYAGGLISINGTYGTATGVFEASDDAGSTFYSIVCVRSDGSASETGYTTLTNTNRQWSCPVGGNDQVRVRSTAVASGTVNVRVGVSATTPAPNNTAISQATPGTTNSVAIKDINNVAPNFTTTAPTAQVGPYPSLNTAGVVSSATPETCASGNVANATVACTLATAAAKTTYISGFSMTADGATIGLAVSCTLTGTITGTMTFTFSYPAGVAVAGAPLILQFNPAIPASTTNTPIVASCPASGTGGTNAAMNAWGYQL